MAPGRRSKLCLTISVSCSLESEAVPYESTKIDIGSATPIAYETLKNELILNHFMKWLTCTSTRLHNPFFTSDFATHRAAYAADRSTKMDLWVILH